MNSARVSARQQRETPVGSGQAESGRNAPALPLQSTVDPAVELDREIARGAGFRMVFHRTLLDTKATAFAEVAVDGQKLLVRVHAKNLPLPEHWREQRYSLWVYLPNYEQKMYIGDLPIELTSGRSESRSLQGRADGRLKRVKRRGPIIRGESNTVFRFTALPRGAIFGGLIITAEPPRYEPILNEPLRPLLIALISDGNAKGSVAEPNPSVFPATLKSTPERAARPARKIGKQ